MYHRTAQKETQNQGCFVMAIKLRRQFFSHLHIIDLIENVYREPNATIANLFAFFFATFGFKSVANYLFVNTIVIKELGHV